MAQGTASRKSAVAAKRSELFKPQIKVSEGEAALGWFLGRSPSGARCIYNRGNEDFGANALLYHYPDTDSLIIVPAMPATKKAQTASKANDIRASFMRQLKRC